MGEMIHDRTPFVTIELQLRPSPPEHAVPWWSGSSTLTFSVGPVGGRVKVWEENLHHLTGRSSVPGRVEWRGGFGWVLVLTLSHERAKAALRSLYFPEFVAGAPAHPESEPTGG